MFYNHFKTILPDIKVKVLNSTIYIMFYILPKIMKNSRHKTQSICGIFSVAIPFTSINLKTFPHLVKTQFYFASNRIFLSLHT